MNPSGKNKFPASYCFICLLLLWALPSFSQTPTLEMVSVNLCVGQEVNFELSDSDLKVCFWQIEASDYTIVYQSQKFLTVRWNAPQANISVGALYGLDCHNPAQVYSKRFNIDSPVTPSVSIAATTPVCANQTVTFTATHNGGNRPSFTWLIDGNNAPGYVTGPTYTTSSLQPNQVVSCQMIPSYGETCYTSYLTTSNSIIVPNPTVSINPAGAVVIPLGYHSIPLYAQGKPGYTYQ
jgi:hypothetical protein